MACRGPRAAFETFQDDRRQRTPVRATLAEDIGKAFDALGTAVSNVTSNLPKIPQLPGAGAPAGSVGPTAGYQMGGWLTEPVGGVSLDSGRGYSFVENRRPEYVVPAGGAAPGARGGVTVHLTVAPGAVLVKGAAGPAEGWADAAEELWADLYRRLEGSLGNRPQDIGQASD